MSCYNRFQCCWCVKKWRMLESSFLIETFIWLVYSQSMLISTCWDRIFPWWHHQMEKFSALLALCPGNSPVNGEFPAQRPVMRSFDASFDLRLNKLLSKQSRGWWCETPSCSLWRHCNDDHAIWTGHGFIWTGIPAWICVHNLWHQGHTVYPKKYAHGFVVLCFVVVMQSFIMNSHEVFIHIHQGCFAGTGAIVRLPQCQWSKPDGYGKISQCITTTKHSKAKTVCIFLGIYCMYSDRTNKPELLTQQ